MYTALSWHLYNLDSNEVQTFKIIESSWITSHPVLLSQEMSPLIWFIGWHWCLLTIMSNQPINIKSTIFVPLFTRILSASVQEKLPCNFINIPINQLDKEPNIAIWFGGVKSRIPDNSSYSVIKEYSSTYLSFQGIQKKYISYLSPPVLLFSGLFLFRLK